MNIYVHELRSYAKSTLVWVLSIVLITVAFLSLYPIFFADAQEFSKLFEGFPPEVLKAMGFSPDFLTSLPGFYSFLVGYITLCGAIQAMNLGVSVLSKETTGKTADFLLTKPVNRPRVLTAKLLAILTHMAVSSVIFMLTATIAAFCVKTGEYDYSLLLMMSVPFFFVQLIFGALGFLAAAVISRIKSVLSVSLSTVFAFFIIGMVGAALDDDRIFYLTPFKYFDAVRIFESRSYELSYVIISAALVAVCVVMSYILYTRKDIHAV